MLGSVNGQGLAAGFVRWHASGSSARMHLSVARHAAALLPVGLFCGCYAAVGPTVGIDLDTHRATVGVEASAVTLTVAQSFALGNALVEPLPVVASRPAPPSAAPKQKSRRPVHWTSRTSLLWEPGMG